jgi:hypothetical protein
LILILYNGYNPQTNKQTTQNITNNSRNFFTTMYFFLMWMNVTNCVLAYTNKKDEKIAG